MTLPPDEHGDILRRVLRAEADAVVPSPEGLEIIRARIDRRGVRNLFWWRAGAAAASAVLVAGTIVMVVPELRQNVVGQLVDAPTNTETVPPTKSSTTRPAPKNTTKGQSPPAVIATIVPETSSPPQSAETAESTKKPEPSPTPTSTPCPTPAEQQSADDCPGDTPTPTPTPTATDEAEPAPSCPADECPPEDPEPTVTDATPISPNGG